MNWQVKKLEVDDQRVRLHLWDTAGTERQNALTYKFYRGANGILLVYDTTNRRTFDDIHIWVDIINKNCHPSSRKILIGNKADQSANRQVSKMEGEAKAKALNMSFYECSARKSGVEVTDAIFKLLTATLDDSPARTAQSNRKLPERRQRRCAKVTLLLLYMMTNGWPFVFYCFFA